MTWTLTTGLRRSIASAMRRLLSLRQPKRHSPDGTRLRPLSPLPPSDGNWRPLTRGSSPLNGRFFVRKTASSSGFTAYIHDAFRGSTWYAQFPTFRERQRYLDLLSRKLPNLTYPPAPAIAISNGRPV